MIVVVKDWFLKKMNAEVRNGWYICGNEFYVHRETEKAYLLDVEIECAGEWERTKPMWCPKSCTMTEKEYEEMKIQEHQRYEEGCKNYEMLIAFCKENGVKGVRVGLRKETIMKKIEDAGLVFAC